MALHDLYGPDVINPVADDDGHGDGDGTDSDDSACDYIWDIDDEGGAAAPLRSAPYLWR